MVIDTHTHAPTAWAVDALAHSMRTNGVDKALVLHWPFDTWDETPAIDLEGLVHRSEKYDTLSVVGSCRITDPASLKKGTHHIVKLLQRKRLHGVKFYPGYEHFYPADERCNDLYDICQEFNVPAIFHSGDTYRHPGALLKYADPIHLDDVATARPGLTIVMAHCGNPHFDNAKAVLGKHPNVYADISGMLSYDTIQTNHWHQQNDAITAKRLVELMAWCGGVGKFMFGTDFPLYDAKRYAAFVNSISLAPDEREALMHRTAAALFRL